MKIENLTEGLLIWGMIFGLLGMYFSTQNHKVLEGRICIALGFLCMAYAIYDIFLKKEKKG
jgi:hypothetical protein